jgi:ribosomal protein S12 methylthiotransferase
MTKLMPPGAFVPGTTITVRAPGDPGRFAPLVEKSRCSRLPYAMRACAAQPPISVRLKNLGCAKNTTDAEVFLGDLARQGINVLTDFDDNEEESDVAIINTCAFVEDAKNESISAILEAARGGAKKVVVTGCLAQRYADELADLLPEATAIVGFEHYADLGDKIRAIAGGTPTSRVQVGMATVPFRPEYDRVRLTGKHYTYLRVAEGCNHACTFCSIPGFRGKFRSKPWDSVVEEIEHLAATGVRELNLIAEDTNQYGMDFDKSEPRRLSDLLRYIDSSVPQIEWVRLLYCYPSYFTEDLIDAIASCKSVVPYVDIPLQHISDPVLSAMQRPSRAHTMKLLDRLRERIPDLALRTTFITGFPGETEDDHRELVNFLREYRFMRAGVFTYSQEDGTPAALLPDQVDDDIKQSRIDELVSIQQGIQEEIAQDKVGTIQEVLIDRIEDGHSVGRCRFDAPDIDGCVHVLEKIPAGTMISVRILGNNAMDLYGEPVNEDSTLLH